MSTIVISDTHLGYELSEHNFFEKFLEFLKDKEDLTDLVILGDFVDMWRRDVSGIFLEFNRIIEKILNLKAKVKVHCIAGNHDYHLLQLTSYAGFRDYNLQFCKEREISVDGITYRFMHGYEFDEMQTAPLMELLCYTMSDSVGDLRSQFWDRLTSITSDVKLLENFFSLHKHDEKSSILTELKSLGKFAVADVGNLMLDPSKRNWSVDKIEMEALKKRDEYFPNTTLIFGHTHVPFFDPVNKIVNSGSWVTNEKDIPFNTFIEIAKGEIQLWQVNAYDDHKITDMKNITRDCTRRIGTA